MTNKIFKIHCFCKRMKIIEPIFMVHSGSILLCEIWKESWLDQPVEVGHDNDVAFFYTTLMLPFQLIYGISIK